MPDNPDYYGSMHPDLPPDALRGDESGQPDSSRKLAGKYNSVEELERGYQNLFAEGQRILAEKQAAEAALAQRSGMPLDLDNDFGQRANPAERRQARQAYVETLADAGVPVDALQQMIIEGVASVVRPMVAGAQAREEVMREYPEFGQFEPEVTQYLETHPDVKAQYLAAYNGGAQKMAMEWAYTQFRKATAPQSASGRDNSAARLDASLPIHGQDRASSVATDGELLSRQQMEAAMKYAQQTGDWTQVIRMQTGNFGMKTG